MRHVVLSAMVVTMAVTLPAWANDQENVNPNCRLEAETNCGWGEFRKIQAPGKDLHDGQFMATRFDEANLAGADFSGAHMQLANLHKADLRKANFEGAHLHAVNLTGADLSGANLTGVNFLDANLEGANLKGATVTRALWTAANLSGAIWVDGRVCAAGSKGECR